MPTALLTNSAALLLTTDYCREQIGRKMSDSVTIEVYFTYEELGMIALAAHIKDMTLNDFIVRAAVEYEPTLHQDKQT